MRRELALREIDRTFDGIKARITEQRDRCWQEAMDSFAARMNAAFADVEIHTDGSLVYLAGPERALARARAVLDREVLRMPRILGEIQHQAEMTWADAVRVRDARRYAFDFGGAR